MNYRFDLSGLEFQLIRDFIHEKYGILFRDEKRSFVKMKLIQRVSRLGLNSFREYFELVMGDEEEMQRRKMISLLTNNESYFFREDPQLDIYRDDLLPQLKVRKTLHGERVLRVLSAGCSTGEEAYTLAMLTFESGGFFWGWDVEIIGLDVDTRALATAREGVYYERSLRMTDGRYVDKYFSPNSGTHFDVKAHLKRMVDFRWGNIIDPDDWGDLKDLDIIFCRNVLIYFSEEKTRIALGNFHDALRPGGYLMLGHSESLTGGMPPDRSFGRVRHKTNIFYQKQ